MMYQHLLPKAKAWTITATKQLREFFTGLEDTNAVVKDFVDAVYLDLFPATTRDFGEWETHFGLEGETLTDEQRRTRLDGAWKATGGQGPEYIRDTLLASGFDLYVHEWWTPGISPAVARNPLLVLNPGFVQVTACGNPAAQCGRAIAQCGGSAPQTKQMALINRTPERAAGIVPSDPALWPFFYYLGAPEYPGVIDISVELQEDLETLCLKISPAQLWIGLLVRYLSGWSIDSPATTYDSISKSVTTEDAGPTGLFFKPDGTKMYMVGAGNDAVYQYTLSVAWNVSTATYDSVSKSVATEDANPTGIFFNPDGLKMYMAGPVSNNVYQYTLSVAWDLSTATYDSISKSNLPEDDGPLAVFFKPDGTKMYMVGNTGNSVYQYGLSVPWDLSTASYDSVSKNLGAEDGSPQAVFFKPDGTKMYMLGNTGDSVYQYGLSVAWDLSTAAYDSVSKSVATEDTDPLAVFFKPDGTKMYVVGNTNDAVYQYTMLPAWGLSQYNGGSLSVGTEDTSAQGVFFKPDGLKMYMAGATNGAVYQYTLATAWDLSTATYDSVSKSVAAEDTAPRGVFFTPDGLRVYVVGGGNDSVYQYTLSTAWDLSTATYDSVSKSVTAEDTDPTDVFFRPDGTKMYVIGATNDSAYQYTLGTAWDLSTATYDSVSKNVGAEDVAPTGIFFKPDGTKMYVIGAATGAVYQYTLSAAWDLSAATYDSVSTPVGAEDTSAQGVFFKPDGLKMYMAGEANDTIYEYNTAV